MLVAAFSWGDLWELALAVFLFAVGISLAYFFVRLAGTAAEVSAFIRGAGDSMVPVIGKVGGSGDRVKSNGCDTAGRAVSRGITRPVKKVSGFAAGVSFGAADFKASRDWRHAVQAGEEAAARREGHLLARRGE